MAQRVYEDKIKDTSNNNKTTSKCKWHISKGTVTIQNQSVEFVIFSVWTLSPHDFSLTENNIKREVGKTPRISWRCYLHRLVSNIILNRIPSLAINFHINQLTSNQFPIVQIDSTHVVCILNLLTGFTRVEHCPHPAITYPKLTIKTYMKYVQN